MKQRQLGNGGPMVSAIGLGCWSFGGAYGPTDEAESHDTLSAAFDLGIDFLDTANVYGNGISENVIGSFIKKNGNKFKIATKVGIYRDPESNVRSHRNDEAYMREELDKSLARLGLDYVDLYYIHRREQERPIEEVMESLVKFKDEGKIGGIGFSEIAPSSLRRAHAVHPVMAVQSEYSLWSRYPDIGMIQTCKELGVAFVPFSPLARGMFATKTPEPEKFEAPDFRLGNPRFVEPNFSANAAIFDRFKNLATEMGTTSIALALAWVLQRDEHLIPIPGTRSRAHLEECAAGDALTLSDADIAAIADIMPIGFAHGDRYSRQQWVGIESYG